MTMPIDGSGESETCAGALLHPPEALLAASRQISAADTSTRMMGRAITLGAMLKCRSRTISACPSSDVGHRNKSRCATKDRAGQVNTDQTVTLQTK